jgi:hypothetical protein
MDARTLIPDEILDHAPGTMSAEEIMSVATKALERASTAAQVTPRQALALVVLGALGGVVASKTLKGAFGVALGAAGLVWAVNTLSKE